jgi:hypothetical protein
MEMLSDHHCKDKFLVQSVVVRDGATMKDFLPELVRSCGSSVHVLFNHLLPCQILLL